MITVCCGKREKAPHVCSCRAFCGEGLVGKSRFLGICYAFALCSAVQEEMVALATLFE